MLLYQLGLRFYYFLVRIFALWNDRAKKWLEGRAQINTDLQCFVPSSKGTVWIHCASLGEFEQGRPLIEHIKKENPEIQIVLTFYSPSGYQIQKDYPLADLVTYLPKENSSDLNHFIQRIHPCLVIFVKYEYWWKLFQCLDEMNIPHIMISARFSEGKYPLNFLGFWTISFLKRMKYIFVQDEKSMQVLKNRGLQNAILNGDTRVDRVIDIAKKEGEISEKIIDFARDHKVLIAGSTWEEDEAILEEFVKNMPKDWKIIIAPHEVNARHLQKIKNRFPSAHFLNDSGDVKGNILIIDCIGILSAIYRLGHLAFVGGGFRTGLHNILEPAAFGLPVIFGPRYQAFNEALDLIRLGGAFSIIDRQEMMTVFNTLDEIQNYNEARSSILRYLESQRGATKQVYKYIKPHIFRCGN